MQIPQEPSSDINAKNPSVVDAEEQHMKAIAYSLDALIPGIYLWCGPLKIRLWGSLPEDNYPGTIHRSVGMTLVLPGDNFFSTYRGSYALVGAMTLDKHKPVQRHSLILRPVADFVHLCLGGQRIFSA